MRRNKLLNHLIKIFQKLLEQTNIFYDEFNSADGRVGDGDLGVTILNGLQEVNNNLIKFNDDMGENFMFDTSSFLFA